MFIDHPPLHLMNSYTKFVIKENIKKCENYQAMAMTSVESF